MPAKNSYILFSHVSNVFLKEMEQKIDNLNLPWWQTTHLPVHLTLGQCRSRSKDTEALISNRNTAFSAAIENLIEKNKKNSAFLLPADIEISTAGWIILKYITQDFETQSNTGVPAIDHPTGTQPTDINLIHIGFEKIVTALHKTYPLEHDPWGKNFMPHISMGKVKTTNPQGFPSPDEMTLAQQGLARDKEKILAELRELRPLNLYDLELAYNNTLGQVVPLSKITLPRRNFHINKVSHQINHVEINFKNKDGMHRFSQFLLILSNEKPLQSNNALSLQVSLNSYEYLVGVVAGCHHIIASAVADPTVQSEQKKISATASKTEQKKPNPTSQKTQLNSNAPAFVPQAQKNTPATLFQPAEKPQQNITVAQETEPNKRHLEYLEPFGVIDIKNITDKGKDFIAIVFNSKPIANDFAQTIMEDLNIVSSRKTKTGKPLPKMVRETNQSYTLQLTKEEFSEVIKRFVPDNSIERGLK